MENFICTKYHHVNKGYLLARVDIMMENSGMEIKQICIFEKNGEKWASFPAKPITMNGKQIYYPFITIKDIEKRVAFNQKIFECIAKVQDTIDAELKEKSTTQNYISDNTYEDIPF